MKRIAFRLVMVAALVGAGWSIGRAQTVPPSQLSPNVPFVVLGENVGFRVEARRGNTPVGRLVIRKDANSEWTPVALTSTYAAGPRQID